MPHSAPDRETADAAPAGARLCTVQRLRDGARVEGIDWIAEEVPVALEFNGISQAVMLATPDDLEDFALGFALSEGLIDRPQDLYGVEIADPAEPHGITLRLEVASAAFARLKDRRRSLAGRTGCGLCGAESLAQVVRPLLPPLCRPSQVATGAIAAAMSAFAGLQRLQQRTGAAHAAAWCDAESGRVHLLREDVGRHNALDKLIGALVRAELDAAAGFIAVTSRASFEMVQKTAMAGVGLLAAVSAPTSLAVTTAERAGLTLVGFARQRDLVVYSHRQRLVLRD